MDDPYRILGVTPASTPAAVKAAYRRLIVEHHPDKLVAAGMAAEFVSVATEKMKRINAAYDQICKARGMT
ncbi:MAG: DnaJ domain-containing protein [Alphaproteobacteria bacterium]